MEAEGPSAPDERDDGPLEEFEGSRLWHVYIDESGDPGLANIRPLTEPGRFLGFAPRTFVMAGVIAPPGTNEKLLDIWKAAKVSIGMAENCVAHWVDMRVPQRKVVLAVTISKMPISIVGVVILKAHLSPEDRLEGDQSYLSLLERVIQVASEFVAEHGGMIRLHIAQYGSLKKADYEKHITARRLDRNSKVLWLFVDESLHITTPKTPLIQVADAAAGSMYAAFEPSSRGGTDPAYMMVLQDRFWHRSHGGSIRGTSLIVVPEGEPASDDYQWASIVIRRWGG